MAYLFLMTARKHGGCNDREKNKKNLLGNRTGFLICLNLMLIEFFFL
jgi:hypothetical protein